VLQKLIESEDLSNIWTVYTGGKFAVKISGNFPEIFGLTTLLALD